MADRLQLPPLSLPIESDAEVRRRAVGRARMLGTCLIALLGVVGLRGAQLTVLPTDRIKLEVAVQRWDTVIQEAPRGQILDRRGHRLAVSRATSHVVADPSMIAPGEVGPLAEELADVLGAERDTLAALLDNPHSRYRVIARHVHPALAARAQKAHDAVYLEEPPTRFYPEGPLASHLLGFVDGEGVGREGLEATYDGYLAGGVLVRQRRRDRLGASVDDPGERASFHTGMSVHLTIDRGLQQAADSQLRNVMDAAKPNGASIVVVDVPTGDVLALANAPSFDPNELSGPPGARRNRAVEYAQELGSVLKPITVAAAVDSGVIPSTGLVDCAPPLVLQGKRISDTHPVGVVSLRTLLAHSSNIGASRLGMALGAERLVEYAHRFGFGSRTGIEVPAEGAGTVRPVANMDSLSVANVAFGQGIAVTPLQLAMAVAALGNDGLLMKPRLVTRVVDAHGVTEVITRPEAVRQAVSPETARAVVNMMVGVTEDEGGTGALGQVDGVSVAGKTGTAEKARPGGRGYGEGRIASFVALVPAEAPRFAVVVVIDDPTEGRHGGGEVAAPIASRLAAHALRRLDILVDDSPGVPTFASADAGSPGLQSTLAWAGAGWKVPDFRGQVAREAAQLVVAADLDIQLQGFGRVVAQSPPPGHIVAPGGTVALTLR